jgi:hypothetical protein
VSFYDKVLMGCLVAAFVFATAWKYDRASIAYGWLSLACFAFATYQVVASPPPWFPIPGDVLSGGMLTISAVLFAIVSGCHLYIRSAQS